MTQKNISEELRGRFAKLIQQEFCVQSFDKISKCVFMNLVGDNNNTKIIDSYGNETAYELFNIVLLITIEFLKKSFVNYEITTLLLDIGLNQELTEGYSKKFNAFKEFLSDPENELILTNFESKIAMKKLVDLDWQQEIIVASKYANKVYQEVYKIQLHLKDEEAADSSVLFKCTLPQLMEINNKLGVIIQNVEANLEAKNIKQ